MNSDRSMAAELLDLVMPQKDAIIETIDVSVYDDNGVKLENGEVIAVVEVTSQEDEGKAINASCGVFLH